MGLVPKMGSRANAVPAGHSERNSMYVLSVIGELEGWEREQVAAATADGNVPWSKYACENIAPKRQYYGPMRGLRLP